MKAIFIKADAVALKQIQRWIADPLQFSGVSLEAQQYVASVVVCAAAIWRTYYELKSSEWTQVAMSGIVVPIYLSWVVYRSKSDSASYLCGRLLWLCLTVLAVIAISSHIIGRVEITGVEVCNLLVQGGIMLRDYLSVATPKPPADNPALEECGAES